MGFFAQIKNLLTGRESPGYAFTSEPIPERSGIHSFGVRIPEPIYPTERECKYGEPLAAALQAAGVGDVTGGGTQMGEGDTIEFVDINVEVTDRDRGLEIIRQTMRACGAPANTVIEEYEPEHRELPL